MLLALPPLAACAARPASLPLVPVPASVRVVQDSGFVVTREATIGITAALYQVMRAVLLAPQSPEIIAYQGALFDLFGDFNAAIRAYSRAVSLAPHTPAWIASNLGLSLLALDNSFEAERVYRRGLEIELAPEDDLPPGVGLTRTLEEAIIGTDPEVDYLWILHSDARPRPDALAALVSELDRNDASLGGSKLLLAGTRDQLESIGSATDVFGDPFSGLDDGEIDLQQYDVVREVAFVSSVSMLVRRDLAQKMVFVAGPRQVGKTTLAYHIAWMLSDMGHKVLVLDLDPQANASSGVGVVCQCSIYGFELLSWSSPGGVRDATMGLSMSGSATARRGRSRSCCTPHRCGCGT